MVPTLLVGAIAGLPGLFFAIAFESTFVGWALSVTAVTVALNVRSRRSTGRNPLPTTSLTGWKTLEREVARARRSGQSLTLVRVANRAGGSLHLADVEERCRELDAVWQDDAIWILAVGADSLGGEAFIDRLDREIAGFDGARARHMTFPRDAMTVRALIVGLTSGVEVPGMFPARPADERVELNFGFDTIAPNAAGSID